jgi:zinc transporter
VKDDGGLIWAYRVDEHGRGESVGWNDLATREHEYLWIHLELEAGDARRWLREESGLSDLEAEVLLAEETRPRVTPVGDGLVLILRGVNLNPGAEPEDMISVRLWADANRVITVRRQRLLALEDLRGRLVAGSGARSVGEFVTDLADRLVERMAGVLGDLDDTLDAIDAAEDAASASERRTKLHGLRREAVTLRRHLLPQRDALAASRRSGFPGWPIGSASSCVRCWTGPPGTSRISTKFGSAPR